MKSSVIQIFHDICYEISQIIDICRLQQIYMNLFVEIASAAISSGGRTSIMNIRHEDLQLQPYSPLRSESIWLRVLFLELHRARKDCSLNF